MDNKPRETTPVWPATVGSFSNSGSVEKQVAQLAGQRYAVPFQGITITPSLLRSRVPYSAQLWTYFAEETSSFFFKVPFETKDFLRARGAINNPLKN